MDELKKQLQEIRYKEEPLKPLIVDFQIIEGKWQGVDNKDLDDLDRIYTSLLLKVPEFVWEVEVLERLLKNAKGIDVAKKRSETVEGKKVYGNLEEAKSEVDLFYQDEEIERIRLEALAQMYKNATEAVAERIRAIKIFLNYANKQSFNW